MQAHVRRPPKKQYDSKYTISMMKHIIQNGVLCDCFKVLTKFLAQNKVTVLEWLGNSPDLNPIENLLVELKDKVSKQQPSSAPELARVIKEVWENPEGVLPKSNRQYARVHGGCDQEQGRTYKTLNFGQFSDHG